MGDSIHQEIASSTILVTHKCILLQTAKTQIKCHIMSLFIRVYTVCYDKDNLQLKKNICIVCLFDLIL